MYNALPEPLAGFMGCFALRKGSEERKGGGKRGEELGRVGSSQCVGPTEQAHLLVR